MNPQTDKSTHAGSRDEFNRAAAAGRTGVVTEFIDFLKHNKKWWLVPIILAMAGIGIIIALGSGGAAPFIYPLF